MQKAFSETVVLQTFRIQSCVRQIKKEADREVVR
jgi:hypothetical protein